MQLGIQNFVYPKLTFYQVKKEPNKPVFGLHMNPYLSCDSVSFSGENVDFLRLPKREIYRRIQDSINNSNLLGFGTEGSVYSIDGTNYCLKFSKNNDSRKTLNKNFTLKVSEQDKVNHIVARLGNDAVIMNRVKGIPISEINKYSFGEVDDNVYRLLSLPNSTYRDLLIQIIKALDYGMEYDSHGGNLIVDFESKTLTAIDFFAPQRHYNEQPLSKAFCPFLSINNISEKLEIAFARKIFDVLLDELKPNVEQKLDFNKVDDLLFLCDLQADHILKISTKHISQIHDLFERLISLKELEKSGADVSEDISKTIKQTQKLLDKYIPGVDSGNSKQVSFTGQKIPLLDLQKEVVFKLVEDSINSKNGLGIGGEADVFAIPNTDYCVRLIGLDGDCASYATRYKDYRSDFSKELTPQDKVNHVVIKLGNGASIMRKIKGEPVYSYFRATEEQYRVAKDISEFPVSAFSGLLRQISEADKIGMNFDPHAANLIANFKDKTFTAIDFNPFSSCLKGHPLTQMYNALCTTDNLELNVLMLKKILLAGLNEFKPNVKPCFDVERFDFIRLLSKMETPFEESDFYRLAYLKSLDLRGRNVDESLQKLIEVISAKVDKLTASDM